MPIHQTAPRRHIGHWKPYYFGNSGPGLRKTAREGIHWHDFDHGITRDGYWRIGHGNPEKVLLPTGRIRSYLRAKVDTFRYRGYQVGRPLRLYRLAKQLGVGIEIEPKGKDPRYTQARYWELLKHVCLSLYGQDWARHYYVKVLKNADVQFSVDVIKAASSVGFHAGPTRDWQIPDRLL